MKKLGFLPLLLLTIVACQSDEAPNVVDSAYQFQDGFEVNEGEFSNLFPDDESRWTNIQLVHPAQAENEIGLTTDLVRDGTYALRIVANPSSDIVSKSGIEKGGFSAPVGSTVTIEVDVYLNSTSNIKNLLLLDLECCSCWDPSVPNNQCPGIRLMMSGDDDYLAIERGKILGATLTQTNTRFPRQEWVHLIWQMKLSPEEDGENKLFINDREVISTTGMNLPNAAIFKEEAAQQNIDFTLQQPLQYERVQVGATANSSEHPVELFIDNFSLRVE
ncbi:MAG: heparin lyase I family protein [Bacteroidota bacterium]